MTPEDQHADAVEAAREWRDEERERVAESGRQDLWVDSGSGPGYEVAAPRPRRRQRGEMPSDREELS